MNVKGAVKIRIKKVCSLALALCILLGCLIFGKNSALAVGGPYNGVQDLGIEAWWHYNAILFGNWRAMQADTEGAMAVAGNVRLAEAGSFSISANGLASYLNGQAVGNYNPNSTSYPAAVLGFNPQNGGTIQFGPNHVISTGDLIMRNHGGAEAAYKTAATGPGSGGISYHSGKATYINGDIIDEFFDSAKITTSKIFTGFAGANASSETVSDIFGNSKRKLRSTNPNTYLATSPLTDNPADKILVVNITSDSALVNLGELHVSSAYKDYDLIVFNFDGTVRSVNFEASTNIFVDGTMVHQNKNKGSGSPYNTQIEWANRVVWLFPEANSITVNGGAVVGSVVAPNASITGKGGSINGMLIAKDLTQQAGFEMHAFGISPLVPDVIKKVNDPDPEPEYRDLLVAKLDETKLPGMAEGGTAENTLHTILPGSVFQLEYQDKDGSWQNYYKNHLGDDTREFLINEDGLLTLPKLAYGLAYRLVETSAPEGYNLPVPNETYFTIGTDGAIDDGGIKYTNADGDELIIYENLTDALRIFNKQAKVELTMVKRDADDNAPIEGAVFGLRVAATNEIIKSDLTSDGSGEITLPALGVGEYRLFEHTAPAGYRQPEAGEYYTILVTDEGTNTADLKVTVRHWDGGEVEAANGKYLVYDIYNEKRTGGDKLRVEFIKTDGETHLAIGGAEFEVYKEVFDPAEADYEYTDDVDQSNMRYWQLLATAVSDTDRDGNYGYIYVDDDDVQIGDTYLLRETKAPPGYYLREKPLIYTVEANGTQYVYRVMVPNVANTEDLGSFSFAKIDDEGYPVYGASFMLFREVNGVYSYTGRSVTLSSDTVFTSENLPEGNYMLRESYLPDGYSLPSEEARNTYFNIRIDVEYVPGTGSGTFDDPYVGRYIGAGSPIGIVNMPWRTDFGIIKKDRATEEIMPNVTFRLYYRANIMEDWQVYTRDGNDGYYTTDGNGKANTWLREGMYMLEEIETWDGYKVTSPMYYTVDRDTTPSKIELRIFNEKRVTGPVDVSKVDALDTSKVLAGSKYTLYAAPDTAYRSILEDLRSERRTLEQVIKDTDIWTRVLGEYQIPDSGVLTIDGLESGLYKLVETTPPDGYTLWGGQWDAVLFEMVYEATAGNDPVVYLGEIFGNHVNTDTGLFFSNLSEDDVPDVPGATITIKKVDHNDNSVALPGTTFSLMRYGGQDSNDLLEELAALPAEKALEKASALTNWNAFPSAAQNTYETGEGGTVDVSDLLPGVYRIEEITPPPGYALWGDQRDVIYVLIEEVYESRLSGRSIKATTVLGAHVQADGEIVFADIPLPDDPYDPSDPAAPGSPGGTSSPGLTLTQTPGEETAPTPNASGRESGSPNTGDNATQAAIFYGLVGMAALCMTAALALVKRYIRRKRERSLRIYWKAGR